MRRRALLTSWQAVPASRLSRILSGKRQWSSQARAMVNPGGPPLGKLEIDCTLWFTPTETGGDAS